MMLHVIKSYIFYNLFYIFIILRFNFQCNTSLHEKLPAARLHAQLDQILLFYATTDVRPDDGPTTSETCRNVVCF
jgi:hypothetical protein